MSDMDKVVQKLSTIEKLFTQNLAQYKEETVKQIDSIRKGQVRQDSTIQELLQQKAVCLEEFDDKIKASEIEIEDKIDVVEAKVRKTDKSWWGKAALIYGIVILMIGFLAVQGAGMKDDVAARLSKDEFHNWKRTELSDIKQEIRDLRKDIKDDLKEFNKILEKHLEKLKIN